MGRERNAVERGRSGEARVAALLEGEGWSVLAANFRKGPGEIDIVAARDGILAFIEVKTWFHVPMDGLEMSLNAKKRRKIVETAKIFLSMHRQYSEAQVRFDVFLAKADGTVERFESAFTGAA